MEDKQQPLILEGILQNAQKSAGRIYEIDPHLPVGEIASDMNLAVERPRRQFRQAMPARTVKSVKNVKHKKKRRKLQKQSRKKNRK